MILIGQRLLPGMKREDTGDVVRRMYRCEFRSRRTRTLKVRRWSQTACATAMTTRRHRHHLVELVASSEAFAIGHRLSELPRSDIPYEMMLVGFRVMGTFE